MPRLDPGTWNIAIGRLQAGESQNEVAQILYVNHNTISRLWNRFQQTGSTNDRKRNGRHRITTPGQDRYIRVFHLRNRIGAPSLQPEYLDCEKSAHKQSVTGFDSMVLDAEDRILERYWRRYTDVK